MQIANWQSIPTYKYPGINLIPAKQIQTHDRIMNSEIQKLSYTDTTESFVGVAVCNALLTAYRPA